MKKYFEPWYNRRSMNEAETEELIGRYVAEAVACHQISDVEVGAFLSGGVDSSYITSLARPQNTYSACFQAEGFDESDCAQRLCHLLHIHNKKDNYSG